VGLYVEIFDMKFVVTLFIRFPFEREEVFVLVGVSDFSLDLTLQDLKRFDLVA
jgi:hypothetical protein